MSQSYANHTHTPRLWGAAFLLWLLAVVLLVVAALGYLSTTPALWATVAALAPTITIGRVYVTALQDRIIKLEMRVRCEKLLSPEQMTELAALPKPQLVALRFASDAEIPTLLARARAENLSADAIKRSIQQWVGDYDRT